MPEGEKRPELDKNALTQGTTDQNQLVPDRAVRSWFPTTGPNQDRENLGPIRTDRSPELAVRGSLL